MDTTLSAASPHKHAALVPRARGFGLHQLLAGRRSTGKDVAPILPVEICKRTGWTKDPATRAAGCLFPSVFTRILSGQRISEANLRLLADGLGVDVEEVRRAHSVTVAQAKRGAK